MSRFNAAAAVAPEASPPAPAPGPTLTVLPAPAAAPSPSPGKPKLVFGALKPKAPAQTASEYPVLPDPDGELAKHAEAFLEAHAKEEAATGAKEAARLELITAAMPFHFTTHHGCNGEIPSSVSVLSPAGEVRVTFKNAYKKLDEAKFEAVKTVIGEGLADLYLTQTFDITIKSDKIPAARMQEVIDAMQELATRLDIVDAISVATCYKPVAEWHSYRFRALTPAQNLKLESLVDREKGFCQSSVSPARGKKGAK